MTAGLRRGYKRLSGFAAGVVRTKILILAAGAIALLLLEIGYSLALQRYDPRPSPFRLRGPVATAIAALAGTPRAMPMAGGPSPRL
jgi:hypothetical protein